MAIPSCLEMKLNNVLNDSLARSIYSQFEQAENILIVSHIRPDGDAIGSLLGLGLSLKTQKMNVQMVSHDGVPVNLGYLMGADQVRNKPDILYDFVVVLDCSDMERTGGIWNGHVKPDINIDHHPTNTNFAKINLVDSMAVATSEILFNLLTYTGLPITCEVATALLTGIVTDSLGFRTSNMTSEVLRISAELMDKGGNLPELYRKSMVNRSFEATKFWGIGLENLEKKDRLVWTTLTIAERKEVNYPGRDDADLINVLSSINGVDIAVIFVEQPNDKVKVSWRAQPGFDVSKIATQLGGGGHSPASGAEIDGNIDEVKSKVLKLTSELLGLPGS
jgi:phosphoesterase RecJ-like protein